jgi:hypothetical protein
MEIEESKQIDDRCKSSVRSQLLPSEPSSSASPKAGSYRKRPEPTENSCHDPIQTANS